ncbi:MAG: T9SS type A sorting domain-containing protein, partial [Bacteroidetes bacterium]|nr:T9SS type A sorting domain-containing protein [Bacteroidota bacterium]
HTFSAGLITTSATPNYLIYESGASYTGDADARHVNGWVRKNGSAAFTFPIGNNTYERAIGITNLAGSSSFTASYAGTTTNTNNLNAPLVSVDRYEYWNLNRVSGGTAQVAMNWDNGKVTFPQYTLADIRVAGYTGGLWTNDGGSASGNVTATGSITSGVLNSFGPFVLASISAALPAHLIDFSATKANGYNLLAWTTDNEINLARYELQRSDDGAGFYVIGGTPAHNQAGTQHYSFSDHNPMTGTAWYRLRSIDNDGKSNLSNIVTIYSSAPGSNFTVVNPAHEALIVSAGRLYNGDYEYRLTSAGGLLVQQGRLTMNNGGSYRIALSSPIAPGIYFVSFRKGGFIYQQKLMIQ